MRLAEETILMLLNEQSGYLEQVQGGNLSCVLAGAVLADLALEDRIDTDLESLILLDATETGDELLDPVLEEIAAEADTGDAEYWIERTAARSDTVLEMVLDRLVEKKILNHHLGDFWSFSGAFSLTRTYSRGDGTTIADVKTRVFRAITEDVAPDPRDAIIIGLVNACDGFRFLLPAEEYEKAKERIELLGSMDLFTRTIAAAVAESAIRLAARAAAAAKPIPRVKLLGMIARRSLRQGNLPRLMGELHQEYGPVFTIRPPFAKRGLTVLAGADANTWVNRRAASTCGPRTCSPTGSRCTARRGRCREWEAQSTTGCAVPSSGGTRAARWRSDWTSCSTRRARACGSGGSGTFCRARRPARASWEVRSPALRSASTPRTTSSTWCHTRSGRWSRTCSDRCPGSC